ncbi:hypothetical protein VUR80DRAFT_344 [Thermomyces stellatus]
MRTRTATCVTFRLPIERNGTSNGHRRSSENTVRMTPQNNSAPKACITRNHFGRRTTKLPCQRASARNSSRLCTSHQCWGTPESARQPESFENNIILQISGDMSKKHKPYGELQPLPVPERPWESITIDFIVKLPKSKDPSTGVEYDSILVVVDRLTKYSYFIPFQEASDATQLAYVFLRTIVANHHLPEEIITDRGATFASKFWRSLMDQLGVNHKLSTAWHPQTDGQTERINQILETYLRAYLNWEQNNWVQVLPVAQIAYNSTEPESTGVSPFYANYGIQPDTNYTPRNARTKAEKAVLQADRLRELHVRLREQLEFIRQRMAKYANRKRIEGPTRRGEKVYLATKNLKSQRPSDKLDFKYEGPFEIEEQTSPVNYKLRLPKGSRLSPIFHVSLLEPAHESTPLQRSIYVEPEEEEFEVEKILDSEWFEDEKQVKYLIKWKGYDNAENTWEPLANLTNCQQELDQFYRRNPDRPGPESKDPTLTRSNRRRQGRIRRLQPAAA